MPPPPASDGRLQIHPHAPVGGHSGTLAEPPGIRRERAVEAREFARLALPGRGERY